MKKALTVLALVVVGFGALFWWDLHSKKGISKQITQFSQKEKPLEKYTYDRLSKQTFIASPITIGKMIKDDADFTSYMFYFDVEVSPSTISSGPNGSGQVRKVSGLMNVPKGVGEYPVIVMFRGYVDQEIYETGVGTQHGGEYFAKNGFITLAPDFLGYGESDAPSDDAIEERFQTYTATLTLLESVKNLNEALVVSNLTARTNSNIGIWGHSNGGQIALTALEVSGKSIPTVLWAPVSKPFPYSILYYTDDFDDHGKALRKVVAQFEEDYDVENYSLTNFLDRINASIEVHQGGADEAVPQRWSDTLVENLKKLNKDVVYFTYAGEDHNFTQGNWQAAIVRSVEFYRKQFK